MDMRVMFGWMGGGCDMNKEIKAAIALLERTGYTGIVAPEFDYEPYRAAYTAYHDACSVIRQPIYGFPDEPHASRVRGLIAAMPHMPRKELTDEFLHRHITHIITAWNDQTIGKSEYDAYVALRNAINEAMT
jgi:hypothetical protein